MCYYSHYADEDSEDPRDQRSYPTFTSGGEGQNQIWSLGLLTYNLQPLPLCSDASSVVGCVLLPSRLHLRRILVGSPLSRKCLSTEQVVASALPNSAPAQAHVLEALCEEGIKSKMLRT